MEFGLSEYYGEQAKILHFPQKSIEQSVEAHDIFSFSIYDFEEESQMSAQGFEEESIQDIMPSNVVSFEEKRAVLLARRTESVVTDYGEMFTIFRANEASIHGAMASLSATMQAIGCPCPHDGPSTATSLSSANVISVHTGISVSNAFDTSDDEHVHCDSCGADMKHGVCPKCNLGKEEKLVA